MAIKPIPYGRNKPEALQLLLDEGVLKTPRQRQSNFEYITGVEVKYALNWGPSTWLQHESTLLRAIHMDARRYERRHRGRRLYYVASVQVQFRGFSFQNTWGTSIFADPEGMVWGSEREDPAAPQGLNDKFEDIKKRAKHYKKENAFKIISVTFEARERVT